MFFHSQLFFLLDCSFKSKCDPSEYTCRDQSSCIRHDWVCDNTTDCLDKSDEEKEFCCKFFRLHKLA